MKFLKKRIDFQVAMLYFLFGALWVLGTDLLLAQFVHRANLLAEYEIYKGWVFIAASAGLIYTLIHRYTKQQEKIEAGLRESDEKYRHLFNSSLDGILLTALDGRVLAANPAACRILRRSETEICQAGRGGLVDSTDPRLAAAIEERARTGAFFGELTFIRKDGSKFPGEISTAVFTDRDGGLKTSMIIRDVSERKKAEIALQESEARFHSTLDNMLEGGQIIDREWRYVYVNDAAEKQSRLSRDDLMGRAMDEVWPNIQQTTLFDLMQKCMEKREAQQIENEFEFLDGRKGWFELKMVPVTEGIFILSNDITQRKITENALIESREELQRLNAELAIRVESRSAQLQTSNEELESFAYSVSHDLKAPLRAIVGFHEMLADRYYNKLDDEGRHFIERIGEASQQMGVLIDALLTLSRVTQRKIVKQTIQLSELAMEVSADVTAHYPDRAVDLVIQDGMCVEGDLYLIKIALHNLLDNAWKFSGRKEKARIEFGAIEGEGLKSILTEYASNERVFFIRDNGVGFDMAYAEKLFTPFQRLHRVSEFPGTGIGLAATKRIINRHGGRIWVNAEVDKGATFYFTIGELAEV